MVVKVGLKPTYNLLLLRNIGYRMICFRKHFHIILELPFELLSALSTCYAHARLDASSILTILMAILRSTEPHILLRHTPSASRHMTLTQKIFAINGNVARDTGLEPVTTRLTAAGSTD